MRRWIAALLTIFMAVNLMTPALFAQETLSDAAWRADVEQLKAGILRLHPDPFRHVSEDVFHASIDSLLDDIPDLSDDENMVRIMQIAASLRDGHSALWPTAQGNYSIHFYPVLFHSFEDGVYVVDAAPQYEDTIGARLVSVGGVDADAAFDMLRASASGDNSHTLTVAIQMNVVEVLRGAGIINDEPNYVLELPDGQ